MVPRTALRQAPASPAASAEESATALLNSDGMIAHIKSFLSSEDHKSINFDAMSRPHTSKDFTKLELAAAEKFIRARIYHEKENADALVFLTEKAPNGRRPTQVRRETPRALDATALNLRGVDEELYMLGLDRRNREHRKRLRWLFDAGRTLDGVERQFLLGFGTWEELGTKWREVGVPDAEAKAPVMADAVYKDLVAYLMLFKRKLGTVRVVMEALSAYTMPKSLGDAYHVFVAEMLAVEDNQMTPGLSKTLEERAVECAEFLERLYVRRENRAVAIPQLTMFRLCKALPVDKVAALYWKLVEVHGDKYAFDPRTVHAFIDQLASPSLQDGKTRWQEAFKILKHFAAQDGMMIAAHSRQAVFTILKCAMRQHDAEGVEEVLAYIHAAGLDPTTKLFNQAMARAAQDRNAAELEKYHFGMINAGYSPDMVTYTILHAFYKRARNEEARLMLLRDAQAPGNTINKYLITDVLHAMVLQRLPYERVYDLFATYFRADTLEELGIAPTQQVPKEASDTARKAWDVDHVVFVVMLMSFTQHATLDQISNFYQTYRNFLYTPRPLSEQSLVQLLRKAGPYLPNITMLGLGKEKQGLPQVAQILEDMMLPASLTAPTIFSWTILQKFLCINGKPHEAKEVFKLMRTQGIEPTIVSYLTVLRGLCNASRMEDAEFLLLEMEDAGTKPTLPAWNRLIWGYATNDDSYMAGDAFRRMLDAGLQPNDSTLALLPQLGDRVLFEAGLAGEPRDTEGVFTGGELEYPKTQEEIWKEKVDAWKEADQKVWDQGNTSDSVFEEENVEYAPLHTQQQKPHDMDWDHIYEAQKAAELQSRSLEAEAAGGGDNVFEEGAVVYPEVGNQERPAAAHSARRTEGSPATSNAEASARTSENLKARDDDVVAPRFAMLPAFGTQQQRGFHSQAALAYNRAIRNAAAFLQRPPGYNPTPNPDPPSFKTATFTIRKHLAGKDIEPPHTISAAKTREKELAALFKLHRPDIVSALTRLHRNKIRLETLEGKINKLLKKEHKREEKKQAIFKLCSPETHRLGKKVYRCAMQIRALAIAVSAQRHEHNFKKRMAKAKAEKQRKQDELVNKPLKAKIRQVEVKRLDYPSGPLSDVPGATVRVRKLYPNQEKIDQKQAHDPLELLNEVVTEDDYRYWAWVHQQRMSRKTPEEQLLDQQLEDQHRQNKFKIWSDMGLKGEDMLKRWMFELVFRWHEEADHAGSMRRTRRVQPAYIKDAGLEKVLPAPHSVAQTPDDSLPVAGALTLPELKERTKSFQHTTPWRPEQERNWAGFQEHLGDAAARAMADIHLRPMQNLRGRHALPDAEYREMVSSLPIIDKHMEKYVDVYIDKIEERAHQLRDPRKNDWEGFADPDDWFGGERGEVGRIPLGPSATKIEEKRERAKQIEDGPPYRKP